eukprot:CAMPEP_0184303702 /NCGR_PEP_ID=MMETSP1049-20130417/13402_1 /TAXON_ID=77928 /ORGANISM="Proteomonas sulcata, Strain CCMP704" /LENGTH=178 /DNA_ID=CAMNT_0026615325 /DNA_START=210 /DNA_END=746 /DNA_ORIENTATION=-
MQVVLTGHSLGGAVSVILAAKLKKMGHNIHQVVAFGSPKLVWGGADAEIEGLSLPLVRVEHSQDPVPTFPNVRSIGNLSTSHYHFSPVEGNSLMILESDLARADTFWDTYKHLGHRISLGDESTSMELRSLDDLKRLIQAHRMSSYMRECSSLAPQPPGTPGALNGLDTLGAPVAAAV